MLSLGYCITYVMCFLEEMEHPWNDWPTRHSALIAHAKHGAKTESSAFISESQKGRGTNPSGSCVQIPGHQNTLDWVDF